LRKENSSLCRKKVILIADLGGGKAAQNGVTILELLILPFSICVAFGFGFVDFLLRECA